MNRVGAGLAVLCTVAAGSAGAQTLADLLPANALHCALAEPPDQAGIAATPGGFVMIYPRNDAIADAFTGCKHLWIVDGAAFKRFATLYFRAGTLAVAVAHDVRTPGALTGACEYPAGKSLLHRSEKGNDDSACAGATDDAFYGLRVPTWPRSCLTDAGAAVCQSEPRMNQSVVIGR